VVGESGSGKTTLALCLLRLIEPSAGRVLFGGEDLLALPAGELRRRRRHFQMVYQDPFGSLDPRQRIGAALVEALRLHGDDSRRAAGARAADLLSTVGLPADAAGRYPHELSGGQRQRVGIARALAVGPRLLVADEPVSALDVSVRSQILNLLAELQQRLGLTLLLIAHDLAAVEQMADRVAVFYLGRIVELAPAADLFARPLHPYTACLLMAVPRAWNVGTAAGPRRPPAPPLAGEPPNPASPPPGCPFHPRCPAVRQRCREERPELAPAAPGGLAATAVLRAPRSLGALLAPGGEPHGRLVACFYPGSLAAISPLGPPPAP
jgi:oligopeptide/dipeptide ABC transporter ATP-binding protein